MEASVRWQTSEIILNGVLRGVDVSSLIRIGSDTGAFVESFIDAVSSSKKTNMFNNLRGTRGLEFASDMAKGYARVLIGVDLLNAYGSFQGDSSNNYQPDWGGVSYNVGSAGAGALALYVLNPGSKTPLAANPATGLILGGGAIFISLSQEMGMYLINSDAANDALDGLSYARQFGQKASSEFIELNCSEFY
jgi:hypothetical protein